MNQFIPFQTIFNIIICVINRVVSCRIEHVQRGNKKKNNNKNKQKKENNFDDKVILQFKWGINYYEIA